MKILIVSDIHANLPALHSVLKAEADADWVLCLGDLVTYGPYPKECISWAIEAAKSGRFIQGNHDRALGVDEDPRCSALYRELAAATLEFARAEIPPQMKLFLAVLPSLDRFSVDGAHCVACHAVPSDPLYAYLRPDDPALKWEAEVGAALHPDYLFVGHTHLPFVRTFGLTVVVNPGSVGQPKDGDSRASYAVWEDGNVSIRRVVYDVERTIRDLSRWQLHSDIAASLAYILRTGGRFLADKVS